MKRQKNPIILSVICIILMLELIALLIFCINLSSTKKYQKHLSLGDQYLNQMDYENAELHYKAAIDIKDKYAAPYINLSHLYMQTEQYADAYNILLTAEKNVRKSDLSLIQKKKNEVLQVYTPPEGIDEDPNTNTGSENKEVIPLHIWNGDTHYSDYTKKIGSEASYIELDDCCKEQYPNAVSSLQNINDIHETSVAEKFQKASSQIRSSDTYLTMKETAYVRRADSSIISVLYTFTDKITGTGNIIKTGATIDAQTGKKLSLSDVVTDIDELPEIVEKELLAVVDQSYLSEDVSDYVEKYWKEISWIMDYQGITFVFNPGEIGSQRAGNPTVTLSYQKYPDLIAKKYQKVPENYGLQICAGSDEAYYHDLNNDGTLDQVKVYSPASAKDEGCSEFQIIEINGTIYQISLDGNCGNEDSLDIAFVHFQNKNYVYIEIDAASNDFYIGIFEITNTNVRSIGTTDSWLYSHEFDNYTSDESTSKWKRFVLTDPLDFKLARNQFPMGTTEGFRTYSLSNDGKPVSSEPWYYICDEQYFTIRRPVNVEVIDPSTNQKSGDTTLQTGEHVLFYRSDIYYDYENDTEKQIVFTDLKRQDGTIVRVWLDESEWPTTIYGTYTDFNDVFEGMHFAG